MKRNLILALAILFSYSVGQAEPFKGLRLFIRACYNMARDNPELSRAFSRKSNLFGKAGINQIAMFLIKNPGLSDVSELLFSPVSTYLHFNREGETKITVPYKKKLLNFTKVTEFPDVTDQFILNISTGPSKLHLSINVVKNGSFIVEFKAGHSNGLHTNEDPEDLQSLNHVFRNNSFYLNLKERFPNHTETSFDGSHDRIPESLNLQFRLADSKELVEFLKTVDQWYTLTVIP